MFLKLYDSFPLSVKQGYSDHPNILLDDDCQNQDEF